MVKALHSKMLLCDVAAEQQVQIDTKKKKEALLKQIDLQWEELEKQKMQEYDERLRSKLEKEYHKKMKRLQSLVHFKETRSGKDLAYHMTRMMQYHEWSDGQRSAHLVNKSVLKNNFVTVYDYDLKLECIAYLLATILWYNQMTRK